MSDIFKFPYNGYDVVICRKQDILDCIDKNIIDKEVALEIVENCEYHAAKFIKEGRWTGIPFIGNIRISKNSELLHSTEQQALIKEAKESLTKEQYVLFRKELNKENYKQIKHNRYYKYIVSISINKNKKLFRRLCEEHGEVYARLKMFACNTITAVNNEYIQLEDDKQ